MEELKTINEIKGIIKEENKNEKKQIKDELIEDIMEQIKDTLKNNGILTHFVPKKNYLISDIKEITKKIGCYLIIFDNEFYVYTEKELNKDILRNEIICCKYKSQMETMLSAPLIAFLTNVFFGGIIYIKNDNIPNESAIILLSMIGLSFIPMLITWIEMIKFKKKKLKCENGIYVFKKR